MFFYHLFPIIVFFKNCFNKSIDCIFSSVKNNWLAKFITNTYNFVSKTARNMSLVFFGIRSIIIIIITLNLIQPLLNFTLCLPFIFNQTLCSCKTFSLLKHCKQYLQMCFLFLFFVLLYINLLNTLI